MDVSIVIPLYNEEESVEALYAGGHAPRPNAWAGAGSCCWSTTAAATPRRSSCGRSAPATPACGRSASRRNYGQTAALQAGFDHARGQVVITLDGDLQNDPDDFGLLLATLDEGYDVVSGWRRDRKDKMISRRLPSMAANWLIGSLTGTRIHDNGCTLKAYRAEVVKRARLYAEMHRFLAPMLCLSGCRYKEVVVNHRARQFGSSKYGISRIWKVFLDLLTVKMLLGFTTRPAKWFAVLALPFLAGTLLALIASVYRLPQRSAGRTLFRWCFLRSPFSAPSPSLHLTVVGLFSGAGGEPGRLQGDGGDARLGAVRRVAS